MKVYFAPNSRAVRTVWLLEEIGQSYELERFTLGQKEMRAPEYTRINPNGRVPTLIDGDATPTMHPKIMRSVESKLSAEELAQLMTGLESAIAVRDVDGAMQLIGRAVDGFAADQSQPDGVVPLFPAGSGGAKSA